MKFLRYTVFSLFSLLTFASCTEDIMDRINENPNNAPTTQAKFIMADLLVRTGFYSVGGDFSLYSSVYMEHECGVHAQMFNAETRNVEPFSATTYNNTWNSTYTNIKNARIIIEKSSANGKEVGNYITLGAAQVMLAYNSALITDLFGDTPFTEAGVVDNVGIPVFMQPKIDKQEFIYKQVFALLDSAIVNFDKEDKGVYGPMKENDFAYNGNAGKWKQLAYALKARYTMRLMKKSSNVSSDMNDVISYISKSFKSQADEFKLAVYNGTSSVNPLYGYTASRSGLGASRSLAGKFIARKDPRASQCFMTPKWAVVTDTSKIKAAPNGNPQEIQNFYDISVLNWAGKAPTLLMSYHELMFIKAEALCRLNRMPEAKLALKDALLAAFHTLHVNVESTLEEESPLGPLVAEQYFNDTVSILFDANPLQETMVQKYLAFWGASGESIEAYNDYRRLKALGENHVKLANAKNAKEFPLRFSYGSSDVIANQNLKQAYGDGKYVYTDNVWWAGGTR